MVCLRLKTRMLGLNGDRARGVGGIEDTIKKDEYW